MCNVCHKKTRYDVVLIPVQPSVVIHNNCFDCGCYSDNKCTCCMQYECSSDRDDRFESTFATTGPSVCESAQLDGLVVCHIHAAITACLISTLGQRSSDGPAAFTTNCKTNSRSCSRMWNNYINNARLRHNTLPKEIIC